VRRPTFVGTAELSIIANTRAVSGCMQRLVWRTAESDTTFCSTQYRCKTLSDQAPKHGSSVHMRNAWGDPSVAERPEACISTNGRVHGLLRVQCHRLSCAILDSEIDALGSFASRVYLHLPLRAMSMFIDSHVAGHIAAETRPKPVSAASPVAEACFSSECNKAKNLKDLDDHIFFYGSAFERNTALWYRTTSDITPTSFCRYQGLRYSRWIISCANKFPTLTSDVECAPLPNAEAIISSSPVRILFRAAWNSLALRHGLEQKSET
jgi:hypothetical protein